jgi:sugar phosphate permease
MLAVLFVVYLLCYVDRMVMASAVPFIATDFGLSPLEMGGVMSAFFLGYSVFQIPGGMLTDAVGSARVIRVSTVCWSVLAAATGLVNSLAAMIGIRFVFGISEAVMPSATAKAIATWFPRQELGRANGIKLAATQIAPALAPLFVTFVVALWGWRIVFYSLLVPGLVLAFVARRYITDVPEASSQAKQATWKWSEVLRTPSLGWCIVTLFLANTANWGLLNWLPTYLLRARGFSISQMGVFASLPFIAGALGFYLGGFVRDRYFAERQSVPIIIGMVVAAIATYFAGTAATGEVAVGYLIFALFFLCIALSTIFTLPLIIVPKAVVGMAAGLVNTGGQLAAFLSPLIVGGILNVNGENFTVVFYFLTAALLIGAVAATRIRQPNRNQGRTSTAGAL